MGRRQRQPRQPPVPTQGGLCGDKSNVLESSCPVNAYPTIIEKGPATCPGSPRSGKGFFLLINMVKLLDRILCVVEQLSLFFNVYEKRIITHGGTTF